MRTERMEKRERTVRAWLQRMREKVDEIQTPLVGAKTKDNRERLCREARAYGMRFENHGEQQGEPEAKREMEVHQDDQEVRKHEEIQKVQGPQKQPVTQGTPPLISYKEMLLKADYLYEKQAYLLAMRLYEECWEYAEDEIQRKILLVKLRRCSLMQ